MIIHYLYNQDTWYFPHRELYVRREAMEYIDPFWLGDMLGVDPTSADKIANLLIKEPAIGVDHYEITLDIAD